MCNNDFQETDLIDDDIFGENNEHDDCDNCEDLNSDYDDFNEDDNEEDEEDEPYDDGEPWDEDKWDDYFNQNMRAGERADMENNS